METLKREGWFRPARTENRGLGDYKETPLYYVLSSESKTLESAPSEDSLKDYCSEAREAVKGFIEWRWVNDWDDEFKNNPAEGFGARKVKRPKLKRPDKRQGLVERRASSGFKPQ